MEPATAAKVEGLLTGMRSTLLRIIQNWESSGQGEGGHDREDDNENVVANREGALAGRSKAALQTRQAFLYPNKPTYLLYLWELADQHQLLESVLQKLNKDVAASNAGSAPTVLTESDRRQDRRRREHETAERDKVEQQLLQKSVAGLDALTGSISSFSASENDRQVRRRIYELQMEQREY